MDSICELLSLHRFGPLFTDALGWEFGSGTHTLAVAGHVFTFRSVARKRGFRVLHCEADRLALADRGLLRKAQRRLAAFYHEHIVIYSTDVPPKQVWQWSVRLDDGGRLRHREHPFFSSAPPPGFVARLRGLRFTLAEEESVSLVDALARVRAALDTTAELNLFSRRPWYVRRSDALLRAYAGGDPDAFHRFILLHRPLAHSIARRFSRSLHLDFEDMQQIAITGLLHAFHKYRIETGCQFSTYATYWVRQVCQRFGPDEAMIVRVPAHILWEARRVRRLGDAAVAAGGPAHARQQLAALLSEMPRFAARWADFDRVTRVASLSHKRDPEHEQAGLLRDPLDDPIRACERAEAIATVRAAIDRLPARDAQIVRWRYGFEGLPLTLEQIGRLVQLTRERVRQVLVKAEERLRRWLSLPFPELADAADEQAAPVQEGAEGDATDEPANEDNEDGAAAKRPHRLHRDPGAETTASGLQESRT